LIHLHLNSPTKRNTYPKLIVPKPHMQAFKNHNERTKHEL